MLWVGDSQTVRDTSLNTAVGDATEKDHGRTNEMNIKYIPRLWWSLCVCVCVCVCVERVKSSTDQQLLIFVYQSSFCCDN